MPDAAASVVVHVEDVSRADAPSQVVAERRLDGVLLRAGQVLPFEIEVPASLIDERRSYSVAAHLGVSLTDQVEVGDLITTQSHPVLTRGHSDHARIAVRRV
ncbi:MAG TPA: YbaY family lipoprotein [Acidimicrobiales bacterium]|nr:YbaY family lipoprotein [Acidimicrobiales bacterium]